MVNVRRLLKAARIYGKNESQWIIIDENIKIRYFKSWVDDLYTIHVFINEVEVLMALNHGGLFGGPVIDRMYKVPKPAEMELNQWARDILKASYHIKKTYGKKARAHHKENQARVDSPYKDKG